MRGGISVLYSFLFTPMGKLPYQRHEVDKETRARWSAMIHRRIMNITLPEANYKVLSRWSLCELHRFTLMPRLSVIGDVAKRVLCTMCGGLVREYNIFVFE